ncbi:MAG: glycosyltransferase family 39 protein [Candidatus Curtissbacteria bacterium]|nr:glycosyltransferase family 39 protein [Candidatus Curtissbacteria bacterium]
MTSLAKFLQKPIIFWILITATYFATRLINLSIIPIFTDEAIYSFWAQVALNDPANRYISLVDGKQPLFIWLAAISQRVVSEPLIASRLVSVFAGFASIVGIYLLGRELFSKKTAILASLLYLVLPFTLLYDRIALYDSLLTTFCIYAVFFTARLAKKPALDTAFLAAFAIGGSLITKSSGFFFLYLMPFSLILFNFKKNVARSLAVWGSYAFLIFVLSQVIFNSLRLSPLFYIIEQKNAEFIRTTQDVITNPTDSVISNFTTMVGWLNSYIGTGLLIVFVASVIYALIKRNKAAIFLSAYIFAPFAFEVLYNEILYPRFMLFYFPFILLMIAYFTTTLLEKFPQRRKIIVVVFALLLLMPTLNSVKLLTDPPSAKIAKSDSDQYFNSWPAGYGVNEVVSILKNESKDKDIYVGTQGTFGLFPYALNIYFPTGSRVHISSYWPVDPTNIPEQILAASKNNKTFFIFNENQAEVNNPRLKEVAKFQKGIGSSYMRLYEVNPGRNLE